MWEDYDRLEKSGAQRDNPKILELEIEIHAYQKMTGLSPYDFNKRWLKKAQMGATTMAGPPPPDSKPEEIVTPAPQSNFNLDQAKAIVGENDFAILEHCIKLAEAWMVCATFIADNVNASNMQNPARRGQLINFARQIFLEMKNAST